MKVQHQYTIFALCHLYLQKTYWTETAFYHRQLLFFRLK